MHPAELSCLNKQGADNSTGHFSSVSSKDFSPEGTEKRTTRVKVRNTQPTKATLFSSPIGSVKDSRKLHNTWNPFNSLLKSWWFFNTFHHVLLIFVCCTDAWKKEFRSHKVGIRTQPSKDYRVKRAVLFHKSCNSVFMVFIVVKHKDYWPWLPEFEFRFYYFLAVGS